jgi:hypothetical protein
LDQFSFGTERTIISLLTAAPLKYLSLDSPTGDVDAILHLLKPTFCPVLDTLFLVGATFTVADLGELVDARLRGTKQRPTTPLSRLMVMSCTFLDAEEAFEDIVLELEEKVEYFTWDDDGWDTSYSRYDSID